MQSNFKKTTKKPLCSQTVKKKYSHIKNYHLPRNRQQRAVSRKVVMVLPCLEDISSPKDRARLFIRKIRLCSYIFSFPEEEEEEKEEEENTNSTHDDQDAKDRAIKRKTLLELVKYITDSKVVFNEDELDEMFEMLENNLFRPFPQSTFEKKGWFEPDEEDPVTDPAWPHLQVVYEFLLRLIKLLPIEDGLIQKYVSKKFILRLMSLFESEDPCERDHLKIILHSIYAKMLSLRAFIRQVMYNEFYRVMQEAFHHSGIGEMLEILGSIINGFTLPIKRQHKRMLNKILIPLHKMPNLQIYHPQISYCITQFIDKDKSMAPTIIMGILRYWPKSYSQKEVLLLNELEEILGHIHSKDLKNAEIPLFQRIGLSIASQHFQVAERAIYVLNNDILLRFVTNHRKLLVPVLAQSLLTNTSSVFRQGKDGIERINNHWNPTIVDLTKDVLQLLQEMDRNLMNQTGKKQTTSSRQSEYNSQRRKLRWAELEKRNKKQL